MRYLTGLRCLTGVCLLLALAASPASASPTLGLRYPSLTPDGKQVVFGYRGDIWVASVDGKGIANRLTIHEEQDTVPRVSPDGKQVAFSSKRNGGYDIYIVSIEGGVPEQITFHSSFEVPTAWSPDGKKLLFASNRDMDEGRIDLYEIDVTGGTPRRVTFDGGAEGSYSPDGKTIVYTRGFVTIYWDNYTGSANHDIYTIPTEGGIPTQITKTDSNEHWPYFSADGSQLYFVAEDKGVANFYAMPAVKDGARTQLTEYKGDDVHRPCLGWDRKVAVFERRAQLYTRDLTDPKGATTALNLEVKSDVRNSGIVERTITRGGEQVHVSNDGLRVAFVLRGDIWTMSATGGNAQRLTSGPATDQWPRWSPDGTQIAYFSNAAGNDDIYLIDVRSGKTRPVTTNKAGDFFHNWAPNGRNLVFCSERSGNKDIWTVELETGAFTQLTRDPSADDDPTYTPDGASIVFDSGRAGPQAIFRMDVDGSNPTRITSGTAFFQVPSVSPDGRLVVYEGMSPTAGASMGLFVTSISGGGTSQLSPDGNAACWAGNGYIYFTVAPPEDGAGRGGRQGIFRVKGPTSVEAGERISFIGRVEVDEKKELGDLFDEAWTALRDGFYDPKMHKVDWNQIKAKYRPIAVDAENKDEWTNVVRQMLAELGASHLGIYGTPANHSGVTPRLDETGLLGLDLDPEPLKDGGRKVVAIETGGPADGAGIRVGDVITKVGSAKLKGDTNLDKVLHGTSGKEITVAFQPLSAQGLGSERSQKIAPIGAMQLAALKHTNWVNGCAKTVEEQTKTKAGEIAYIHLDQMNPENLQRFQSAVAGWISSKKIGGMILDIRGNGGGNIHNQLMAILTTKPLAQLQRRGMQEKVTQPSPVYWDRPIVVLTNERSFSDAEVFPFMFKAAGRGKVIGTPTAGGVIGTNDITLSDGTQFRIPRVGFWGMDGTNLEGLGVKPDVLVEETPEDRVKGRDPQLAKAIEVIQAEVALVEAAKKAERDAKQTETAKPETGPDAPKVEAEKKDEKEPVEPVEPVEPQPENPAATGDALHPLADVRTGEWVRYRVAVPGADATSILKLTVTEVTEDTVRVSKELEEGTMMPPMPDSVKREGVLEMLPLFGQVLDHKIVDGLVGEHEAKILNATVKWPDGSEIVMEFTNAIPAYGLLRVTLKGTAILEAIEWGGAEAKEPEPETSAPKKEAAAPVAPAPKVTPEAEKPLAEKPAAEKPATVEPARAKAAEGDDDDEDSEVGDPTMPVHPLFDAKEGEWVRVKQKGPGGQDMEMTTTVDEVDAEDNVIFLKRTFHHPERGDIEIPQRQKMKRRQHMRRPNEDRGGFTDVKVSLAEEIVQVGGKDLKCFTISGVREGVTIKWYYCPKVPVDGLVRVERDGEAVLELVEFGSDDK